MDWLQAGQPCQGDVLLLLVGLAGAAGQGQEQDLGGSDALVISMSSRGPWGSWTWLEMCPKGSYASGVSFKLPQGLMEDDMALTCSLPVPSPWLESLLRHWCCDEVAATGTCFTCSNRHILEGPRSSWGQWGSWSPQCPRVLGAGLRGVWGRTGLPRDFPTSQEHRECCQGTPLGRG
uniref:Uncharacterized protein n=1 Tax=Calidris pygmaea TaxID=425635 RepID=A0A8C3PMD8_9CHAR